MGAAFGDRADGRRHVQAIGVQFLQHLRWVPHRLQPQPDPRRLALEEGEQMRHQQHFEAIQHADPEHPLRPRRVERVLARRQGLDLPEHPP